jgi:hypothetical protein
MLVKAKTNISCKWFCEFWGDAFVYHRVSSWF